MPSPISHRPLRDAQLVADDFADPHWVPAALLGRFMSHGKAV